MEGRGQESTQWGKDVRFLLDNQEGHSRGGGVHKNGEIAGEEAVVMSVLMSFIFFPFIHQHN